MREGITAPDTWRQEEFLRRKRRRAIQYRRRRVRFTVAFAVFCLAVAAVVTVAVTGASTSQVADHEAITGTSSAASAPVQAEPEERPAFARLGERNLILPVAAGVATIIAYQPISDERALELTPIGDKVNTAAIVRFLRGIFAGEPLVRYYQLPGDGGSATNSVLVGAPAGSPVTSPVSGIVTGVKEYKLYGRYDDVQIEIRPEELSGATLSLMLISDPAVTIGEVVSAGKTQLGKVRECPPELSELVARYTHDSGAHVHLKVTEEPVN